MSLVTSLYLHHFHPHHNIFDIDDEIIRHDLDDDSSPASYSGPIDQRVSPTVGDA